MSKKMNVPKLRFKEFSGEWEETILKNISTFYNGRAYKQAELLSSGKYQVLRVGNFFTNDSWYYSDLELDENKYCDNGDLLYAWSASFGPRIWKGEKVIYHYHIWKVENHDDITKKYLYILLDNETAKIKAQSANGFALLHITKGTIENWKVNIPSKQEQEKIASFLTSVDTKIEQLTRKEKLLQQYKKGVMQKIFSQEIRFKADDGSEFEDWKEKKLGDIGEFKTSSVDKKTIQDEELVYLVNYMNVYNHENINNQTVKNYMRVSAKENQILTSDLKKGDILFTPSSETPDDIGHSVVIFEDLENTVYSYHLMRFRPKVKLDILYSHYFCNIPEVLKQITKVSTGSTRFTISVGGFSKIVINLPCLEEQTKIANFLSSIDSKIEQVQKQLNSTKEFKKALLQQMFV